MPDLLRWLLLAILGLGLSGTGIELLLLGHTELWQQWVPLTLIALGLVALAWFGASGGSASLWAIRLVMGLCVVSGFAGVVLHYQGNVEFARETYPSIGALELFRRAMTGATPALAPGTMIQLGLVGLASTFRHRASAARVRQGASAKDEEAVQS
jgi:hypothetical protein